MQSLRTVISCCQQLSQVVGFHLGAGLTTIFSFSVLCSGTSSAVTADLSGNITLPTISAQIASQNIPLLASQRREPIFLTAAVELIHSPAACLSPKTPNSRCQRLIQKANSCKIVKSQHLCAELQWKSWREKAFCSWHQCHGNSSSAAQSDQLPTALQPPGRWGMCTALFQLPNHYLLLGLQMWRTWQESSRKQSLY